MLLLCVSPNIILANISSYTVTKNSVLLYIHQYNWGDKYFVSNDTIILAICSTILQKEVKSDVITNVVDHLKEYMRDKKAATTHDAH